MAVSSAAVKVFIFTLVFSIMFGLMGVAFTTFVERDVNVGAISQEQLLRSGIIMRDTVTHNVSRNDTVVEYALADFTIEMGWGTVHHWFLYKSYHAWFNFLVPGSIQRNDEWYDQDLETWVAEDFDPNYNWTHRIGSVQRIPVLAGPDRFDIFYQYDPTKYDNINEAITDGNLTITIGRGLTDTPSWTSFLGWYIGMSLPTNTFGFPWYLSLILMLNNILVVLSLYLLIRG